MRLIFHKANIFKHDILTRQLIGSKLILIISVGIFGFVIHLVTLERDLKALTRSYMDHSGSGAKVAAAVA